MCATAAEGEKLVEWMGGGVDDESKTRGQAKKRAIEENEDDEDDDDDDYDEEDSQSDDGDSQPKAKMARQSTMQATAKDGVDFVLRQNADSNGDDE